MHSRTIRDGFFAFFEERAHTRVPSSSLVPNDPTLLLTNAGMNQFKPFFLGEQEPPSKRAMSVQKCFRTTDIEEVGKTARHLTFFEMLGNFSFGDYYKEKACPWAWTLVTEGYGIDVDRLWVTVFQTDDEAERIWIDQVGVRPERVIRRGVKDNFWYGAGPCGPCSEIFVDLGERYGEASDQGPAGNEDRYLEIWNLVFMQNECTPQMEPIAELPRKNIDTGLGVERMAMVLQQVDSVYETDTLGALVERSEELTGRKYGSDQKVDMGLRILADHGRALTFLIADGVLPSNEERGYVLRRVMRRAVRHARLLGRQEPVLAELVDRTVQLMGDVYPEIKERYSFIVEVANREEERFDATLKQGLTMLEDEISKAKTAGRDILGDVAFKLHDTFGFPIDITTDIASDAGLGVDAEGFEKHMAEQRSAARKNRRSADTATSEESFASLLERKEPTEFIGFEHLDTTGSVLAIADAEGWEGNLVANEGDEVDLILDRTVFYAEGGGQVGDRGVITGPTGEAQVFDTRKLVPGVTGHRVRVRAGEFKVGDEVVAHVDPEWRFGSQRAHTATHILHWELREKLGDHAKQAGSLVEPGRLRFDFSHFDALGGRVDEIGEDMQTRVLTDDPVRAYETSFDYAKSIGAMAIFGEKYGDVVRVVEVGDYSKELCGGTHVPHTSRIGVVVITGEGSVGANLRRVEALVGPEGIEYLQRKVRVLERAAEMLKTNPDEVAERVEKLLTTQKDMERRIAEIERSSAASDAAELASSAEVVNGTRLVVARRDMGVDGLRSLAQKLKGELGSAVVLLGTVGDSNANLVAGVTKDLVGRGVSARDLLAPGAELLGGGGGGKPELSISGGPNKDRLDEALKASAGATQGSIAGMILGIDPGERRVGLALADLETGFARPLEVIDQKETDALQRIQEVIREMGVTLVVVGRPVALAGIEGPTMEKQKTFLVRLRAALDVDVDVYDERLTTVLAEQGMRAGGTSAKKRKAIRDAVAAQVMLQGYVDSPRELEPVTMTRRGRIVFSLGGFLLVLALLIGGGYLYLKSIGVYGSSDAGKDVRFEIPKGSSSGDIGEILKENDVIPSTLGWRLVTLFDNRSAEVQAGFYEIPTGLIPRDALDALIESGPTGEDFVNVTFPEGLWLTEMAARLERETDLSGDRFLDLVTKGRIRSSVRPKGVKTMEGLLFPSTYQVVSSDTEETVAQRLADEMIKRFAQLDTTRAEELGLTDYELIIVASMIEAETRVDEERPMVARVIYNRLAQDIPLGIDATFQYALGERKAELTPTDLALESPYNLRENLGLPPTPIGAPGQASLEAAANPADGALLYYVLADCEGNHAFSETNDEFLADKAAYQALDC